jgi:LacI family transcriptional regulator
MDILAVARRAGVSSATVSRVVNSSPKVLEKTAARVRKAIDELGYVPNVNGRILRSGQSNLYGIIVSDIRNPFFPDLIEHFESLADQYKIDVTVANTGYSEERLLRAVRRLLERGVDGIAVLTSEVSASAIEKIRESKVSCVFLNQPSLIADFENIAVDYLPGFQEAIEHLSMLGHTRIAFAAGPPSLSSAIRRKKAFLSAMKNCRLLFDQTWLFQGDHRITGGQFVAERIFSMKKGPTAVVCSNDMTAIGILQTAYRLGRRIPKDFSVVGFDGLLLGEIVQPALTTLSLSRSEIATRAFYTLYGRDKNSRKRSVSVILPRLLIRSSTAQAST